MDVYLDEIADVKGKIKMLLELNWFEKDVLTMQSYT